MTLHDNHKPKVHEYYIAPGIDGAKVHADAQKRARGHQGTFGKAEESIVHNHAIGNPCNKKCVAYAVVKPSWSD